MMETSKSYRRRKLDPFWTKVFRGTGIDIGAGDDPFRKEWFPQVESVIPFDREEGNAQEITRFVKNQFDFVHSSNCLEHMTDPEKALAGWWELVKPGGYLVFTVPDEDLYEQGTFPSRWNPEHNWTFTLYKQKSWHEKSINVVALVAALQDCQTVRMEIADTNYDYDFQGFDQTVLNAEAFIEVVLHKRGNANPEPSTFKHSGARGDIIYSLPTIKALGGGRLFLVRDSGAYSGRILSEEELGWMRKMLVGHCGITDVQEWAGQQVQYNLDRFRSSIHDFDSNLSRAHLEAFNASADLSVSWLDRTKFTPRSRAAIIISRSGRYAGPLRWQELANWTHMAMFVGFEDEWKKFMAITGFFDLPLYVPTSYADMCEILLGCKLFVGNQSFMYSLAEALKVNRVQETSLYCPNCLPQSGNGHVVLTQQIIDHYVMGDGTPLNCFDSARALTMVRNRFSGKTLPRPSSMRIPMAGKPLISFLCVGDTTELEKGLRVIPSKEIFKVETLADMTVKVRETKGDFICLVEEGTQMEGTWFNEMQGLMNNPNVGAVSQFLEMKPEMHLSGGVVLVARRAWQECGLFDREAENKWLDLSLKLKRSGYTIRQVRSRNIVVRVNP
jgi:SAM-dependent methyltransferase